MNYEFEFNRLLNVARQAVNVIDFKKRSLKSFAEMRVLNNAVTFYDTENEQDDPADSLKCPKCGEPEPVLCCENCGHTFNPPQQDNPVDLCTCEAPYISSKDYCTVCGKDIRRA